MACPKGGPKFDGKGPRKGGMGRGRQAKAVGAMKGKVTKFPMGESYAGEMRAVKAVKKAKKR
jgi:hypothetical protein